MDRLPRSPDFVLSEPGSGFTPTIDGSDSVEARQFKEALRLRPDDAEAAANLRFVLARDASGGSTPH